MNETNNSSKQQQQQHQMKMKPSLKWPYKLLWNHQFNEHRFVQIIIGGVSVMMRCHERETHQFNNTPLTLRNAIFISTKQNFSFNLGDFRMIKEKWQLHLSFKYSRYVWERCVFFLVKSKLIFRNKTYNMPWVKSAMEAIKFYQNGLLL